MHLYFYSDDEEYFDAADETSSESEDETQSQHHENEQENHDDDSDDFLGLDNCEFNEPLFTGSALTVGESFITILTFVFRHKINYSCLADLLLLISIHCNISNRCIRTVYKFKKIMKLF